MNVALTTRMIAVASDLWAQGVSIAGIADRLGVNKHTLASFIRKNHDIFPNRHHHADVWRARLEECEGMTVVQTAMKYGVSKSTIQQWKKTIRESELEHVGS